MSKRRNRRLTPFPERRPSQPKSTAVLERDEPQESRAGRVPQIRPGGQNLRQVTVGNLTLQMSIVEEWKPEEGRQR